MSKERKQMIDKVIRRYGFEASETIMFCTACEDDDFNDNEIVALYNNLME